MSLTRKVAFNTIIQVFGKVATTIISLFLVAALTRYLGVAGYGQYTAVFAYISFFAVLADFGFFWILVREIAQPDANINKSSSNILTMRSILALVFFSLAFAVGWFIPQYHDFRAEIGIVAFASFFLTLNSTYVGVFQNRLRMDKAVITDVIGRAVILILTVYLIRQELGLNAILWAYAIGNIVNFFTSAWLGQTYVHFRPAFDLKYWQELIRQAVPMGIVLILGLVYFRIDSLMLSLMKGPIDVGIYGPPYKVLEILMLFPSIFMGNVFPIVTRYIYTKDEKLQLAMQKSFDFLFMIGVPIVLGVVFTATRIIKIVAGQEFVVAHTIAPVWGLPATSPTALKILIFAVGVSFISHMFGYLVIALGKQQKMIWPYLFLAVFNIGLNLLLIPKLTYIGAAISTVLTEILVLIFSWYAAHKYVEIKINLKIAGRVLLSGVFLGLFLYFIADRFHLLILIPLSIIIYLAVLWIFKGIDKQMFSQILLSRDQS